MLEGTDLVFNTKFLKKVRWTYVLTPADLVLSDSHRRSLSFSLAYRY